MIDNLILQEALDILIEGKIFFKTLGMTNSEKENTLTFCDTEKFVEDINNNPNINGVFITECLTQLITRNDVIIYKVSDPRHDFYTLYNYVAKKNYIKKPNVIHSTAKIHPRAYIADYNVEIGKNVIIEPNACILADVIIGDNCIIQPGACIGSFGYEYKRTSKGIISVFHDGKVIIGNQVEIGANTCIDKGFSFRNTIIGDNNKIDNLIHIAHGVQTGSNNFIIACSMVAGSVTIKNNVWIGPNSSITPQITVHNNAFVTLGSVVTKNVEEGKTVSGNFAIEHKKFLSFLKSIR